MIIGMIVREILERIDCVIWHGFSARWRFIINGLSMLFAVCLELALIFFAFLGVARFFLGVV